jgi:dTDP-4-dehydrorhamnose reductase
VASIGPDVIVNAAAYTAVDRAESEEALAHIVNGAAVKALASAAHAAGALLVHYSTDYVFDGGKHAPYVEDDTANPINAYGRSKLAGELAIRDSGCEYLIFRTGWVYAARGRNFLRTILRLAGERDQLDVVADQVGTPNWARNIADVTAHAIGRAGAECMADTPISGVFHLTASGSTSWHGFAAAILEIAAGRGLLPAQRLPRLRAIPTEAYPRPAARPRNSRLAADRLKERFGIALPDWKKSLELCMQEMIGNDA